MRILCRDNVIAINEAMRDGKQLVFKAYDGVLFNTDDYYHENIALSALCDLAVNGYIRVTKLHIKEDF